MCVSLKDTENWKKEICIERYISQRRSASTYFHIASRMFRPHFVVHEQFLPHYFWSTFFTFTSWFYFTSIVLRGGEGSLNNFVSHLIAGGLLGWCPAIWFGQQLTTFSLTTCIGMVSPFHSVCVCVCVCVCVMVCRASSTTDVLLSTPPIYFCTICGLWMIRIYVIIIG
jgi:hypothetical protein